MYLVQALMRGLCGNGHIQRNLAALPPKFRIISNDAQRLMGKMSVVFKVLKLKPNETSIFCERGRRQ